MLRLRTIIAGLGLLSAVLFVTPKLAAAKLGDPAAPLKIAEWVKGKPVDLAAGKGKRIFVIEFWATWCPPCRESIPHLTELQKQFGKRGVVFVGVSNEDPKVVRPFVKKMGDRMDYRVAVDQNDQTSKAYMEAYGQNGIPTAFVVDQAGNVVWVGHPMGDLARTLEAILAGKYDLKVAALRDEGMKLLRQFFRDSQSPNVDEAALRELAAKIEKLDQESGGLVAQQRLTASMLLEQATSGRLLRRYQEAVLAGKPDAELAGIEKEVRENLPAGVDFDQFKRQLLQGKLMRDYLMAAAGGKTAEAQALAPRVLKELKSQPAMLNQIAWTILTGDVKHRDQAFALEVARAAMSATREQDPNVIDTFARALFDNGHREQAIAWQKKAVELAPEEEAKSAFRKTLEDYQAQTAGQ